MSVKSFEGKGMYVPSPFQLETLTSSNFFLNQSLAWEENQSNTVVVVMLDMGWYLCDQT
jgi:hypothetical protein